MKKGFTLVELLAVIAILGIIVGISIPVYLGISNKVKQSVYETKVENIKAKASVYASDTNNYVFDVKALIENGNMEADNELGEYMDPVKTRDMRCDVINVVYENGVYEASVTPSDTCYQEDELENIYGMVNLRLYKDKEGTNEITKYDGTDWTSDSPVYVRYNFTEKYQSYGENITSVIWSGENEKKCTSDNLSECAYYEVSAETLKNIGVNFEINVIHDEISFTTRTSTRVMIDKQSPIVEMATLAQDSEVISQKGKKVEVDVGDGNGSGVKEYSIVDTPSCDNATYKELNNNRITEYLFNGTYYICIKDKVGNKNTAIESTKFEVKNIDSSMPVIDAFNIKSKNNYNGLNTTLTIKAHDDKTPSENLKMCVSNTGFLKDCSWEVYKETKDWTLTGTLDGGTRTVYLSILDEAGNVANKTVTYTVYRECSKTTKGYTAGWSGCTAKCGGGTQTRAYAYKDNYTGKTCSTGNDTQKCNTMDCCSSIYYKDGANCTAKCGGGTKNRLAYSSYNNQRCSSKDQSSGGSKCNTMDCCSSVRYVDGSSCSASCGGGTKNRLAYSNHNGQRCSNKDQSSGGSSCNTQGCEKILYSPSKGINELGSSAGDNWDQWKKRHVYRSWSNGKNQGCMDLTSEYLGVKAQYENRCGGKKYKGYGAHVYAFSREFNTGNYQYLYLIVNVRGASSSVRLVRGKEQHNSNLAYSDPIISRGSNGSDTVMVRVGIPQNVSNASIELYAYADSSPKNAWARIYKVVLSNNPNISQWQLQNNY